MDKITVQELSKRLPQLILPKEENDDRRNSIKKIISVNWHKNEVPKNFLESIPYDDYNRSTESTSYYTREIEIIDFYGNTLMGVKKDPFVENLQDDAMKEMPPLPQNRPKGQTPAECIKILEEKGQKPSFIYSLYTKGRDEYGEISSHYVEYTIDIWPIKKK